MCGQEFAPPPAIVTAMQERRPKAEVRRQKSRVRSRKRAASVEYPDSAFADPRLLSACPHCQYPLQFNPFFAAAENYAEVLRRGLEHARREKGHDHEETLAHLAALAANPADPPFGSIL